MTKFITNILFPAIALAVVAACGTISSDQPSGTGSGSSSTAGTQFTVTIRTLYEGANAGSEITHAVCSITSDSTPAGSGDNTCTVSIPEGQLYFSKLQFVQQIYGGKQCTRVSFNPYFAIRSVNAAYVEPETAATVDCSVAFGLMPLTCFEGAAKEIVTGFPVNTGRYVVTDIDRSDTYELSSGNAKRQAVATSYDPGNLWGSNNLPDASRGAAINMGSKQFVGGAANYQDYEFQCLDAYEESLYNLIVYVLQADGATNAITDWQ